MLVKIKHGDKTLEFNSTENAIAILFTPNDKVEVEKMAREDLLFLSAPLKVMRDGAADVWHWAFNDWKGATRVA